MILRPEHIAASRINWNSKSQNLRLLAEDLNLGSDSFIFIDDSPIEIAEVNAGCPEVLAIQLPSEGVDLSHFFENIWAFDRLKVTSEDKQRTAFYQSDREREKLMTVRIILRLLFRALTLMSKFGNHAGGGAARVPDDPEGQPVQPDNHKTHRG